MYKRPAHLVKDHTEPHSLPHLIQPICSLFSTMITPQAANVQATITQPQAGTEMNAMNASAPIVNKQAHIEHQHKPTRLRGAGAAKDCFLGLFECFLCFECCKGCCECCADIICCPCEMCC